MNRNKMSNMPAYADGYFTLYDIVDVKDDDMPVRTITPRLSGGKPVKIWFRELAVFDRTRATLQQADVEVSRKIAVPLYRGYFSSMCVCLIHDFRTNADEQYKIYNCAEVLSKQGYMEAELTLMSLEVPYEVSA